MHTFTFGIYPGGATGDEVGMTTGPADVPERIMVALNDLQPPGKPFIVRAYMGYAGNARVQAVTPENFVQYVRPDRKIDLVLCYRAVDSAIEPWPTFIQGIIKRYGPHLTTLQITEEANSTGPGGDGVAPNIRAALVAGVLAAKDEIRRLGLAVGVGFSATINFNPADDFWPEIGRLGGPAFIDALDYVALDFFPDVFSPLPVGVDLGDAVRVVLHLFRTESLAAAGIPATVPVHIGENGWPTSPTRSYERQAEILDVIIRAVHEHRQEFNVTKYELFDLRDADSSNPAIFYQFGLLRDDYSPKPAYAVFRRLVAELSE